jgi:hypothetical protein
MIATVREVISEEKSAFFSSAPLCSSVSESISPAIKHLEREAKNSASSSWQVKTVRLQGVARALTPCSLVNGYFRNVANFTAIVVGTSKLTTLSFLQSAGAHVTPSIRKSWHQLRRHAAVARPV